MWKQGWLCQKKHSNLIFDISKIKIKLLGMFRRKNIPMIFIIKKQKTEQILQKTKSYYKYWYQFNIKDIICFFNLSSNSVGRLAVSICKVDWLPKKVFFFVTLFKYLLFCAFSVLIVTIQTFEYIFFSYFQHLHNIFLKG